MSDSYSTQTYFSNSIRIKFYHQNRFFSSPVNRSTFPKRLIVSPLTPSHPGRLCRPREGAVRQRDPMVRPHPALPRRPAAPAPRHRAQEQNLHGPTSLTPTSSNFTPGFSDRNNDDDHRNKILSFQLCSLKKYRCSQ